MTAARVLSPVPSPSAMPEAMAITFLSAPATSQPITSGLVYTRKQRRWRRASWSVVRDHWVLHRDDAAGGVAGQDLLGQVGAGEHAAGMAGQLRLDAPAVMRSRVPCSSPFERLTTGTHGRRCGASSSSVARKPCDGHAHHEHVRACSLPPPRTWWRGGSACRSKPARYCELRCSSRTSAATSARRAHSVVGVFLAQRWATVVPHEPPPITATCIGMDRRLGPRHPVRLRRW